MHPSNHAGIRRIAQYAIIAALFFLPGCGKPWKESLLIPETPLFVSESTWVLAKEAYVRMKISPDPGAADSGFLKQGEILPVKARVFKKGDKNSGGKYWFLVSGVTEGWVVETDINTFDSADKARSARGVE